MLPLARTTEGVAAGGAALPAGDEVTDLTPDAPRDPEGPGVPEARGAAEAPAPSGRPRPPGQWPTGRLISAVARRIERDWNAHLAHWDLNHASLPVLYLLAGGPLSQRELAEWSGVTEQTMSRIIARLDRTGYIERRAHAHDRRRYEVALTDSGRQALREAGDPRVAEQMSIRGLTPEQVSQLRDILGVMMAERPGAGDPPAPPHDPPAPPHDASDDAPGTVGGPPTAG